MSSTFCISIPIGAYHPFLRHCLASLAIQNPRPQVALLDASSDARVHALADQFDDLLSYRRHGPDGGQSDAILEGWAHLDGDILGWLNADDFLYPDALKTARDAFKRDPQADVVYGHSVIIDDDSRIKGYHWAVEPPSERLLFTDIISQPSCFFRRTAYEAIGGLNKDLHYTMDWDLWVRLWEHGAVFSFIDETLSGVLWTRDAKTGGLNAARRAEISAILKRNVPLSRRIKSQIGFGLHYLFEYVAPAPIARRLRGAVRPDATVINGIGRNGEIVSEAALPIVHYDESPKDKILLTFHRGAASAGVLVNGAAPEIANSGDIISLQLDAPIGPGVILQLDIKNTGPVALGLSCVAFA
ncbi:MAG: glycosyltransferase [Pseudomonadota bacterium]